jgi:hypothetical protein
VKRPAGEAAAAGQAHGDVHRQPLAVEHLARDVDDLVKAAGDEVGELHLADRAQPDDGGTDRRADDPRLGERRVHHPFGTELLDEAVGDLERAAVDADVLAHEQDAVVPAHLGAQTVGDRAQVGHLGHEPNPLHGAAPSPSRISSASRG